MTKTKKYSGHLLVEPVTVRFSFSGQIASVNFHSGHRVKKGDILAVLKTTDLQTQLDLELASYEKIRAQFELFHQKYQKSSDPLGYLSRIEQSELDISVKRVELAKVRLDDARLISPVDGLILDDGGCLPGINIAPAANSFILLPDSPRWFQIEIYQEDLIHFSDSFSASITFKGSPKVYTGMCTHPVFVSTKANRGIFSVKIRLEQASALWSGMEGEMVLHPALKSI